MRLPGENQLIDTVFLPGTALQMKLKSGQAQMKADDFMHFDPLAKHSPVNHAALLFDLMQELENRFQAFWEKISILLYLWLLFSQCRYVAGRFSDGMGRAAI